MGFGSQRRPARIDHQLAHFLHQLPDIAGLATRIGLDEVGVFGGDLRSTDAEPFATGGVDEAAGGVSARVGEDRAGIGPTGLMCPTPAHDLFEQRRGCVRQQLVVFTLGILILVIVFSDWQYKGF